MAVNILLPVALVVLKAVTPKLSIVTSPLIATAVATLLPFPTKMLPSANVELKPVEFIVMLPEPLVMLMFVPAVNVEATKLLPLPMSICPFEAVLTPVPPFVVGSTPVTSAFDRFTAL
jgi:hypothetical protein